MRYEVEISVPLVTAYAKVVAEGLEYVADTVSRIDICRILILALLWGKVYAEIVVTDQHRGKWDG